jgi:hypothetical protein
VLDEKKMTKPGMKRVRQTGHYAAGADGTQDVHVPTGERPVGRASTSTADRRPRKIR